MITNTGKSIIGKYMLGQTSAYASYIAVGCGPKPLSGSEAYGDYSQKTSLDFEMFRVPISSRGFVDDNGTSKIVLTAELPTEERYEITEVGIFSAGSNPSAGAYDSRLVFSFSETENWQHHTSESAVSIPSYYEPLDQPLNDNVIANTETVFQTNSNNTIFYKSPRVENHERGRFLNNMIMIRGDDANLGYSSGHLVVNSGSNHIHLTGVDVDFTRNSPTDELRLAFSLVNKSGSILAVPDNVRILVEFASTDESSGEFARFELNLTNGTGSGQYDFENNRYYIISKQLQELYITSNFTWNAVTVVKIYGSVIVSGTPSDDYYISLDAMRLENTTTVNPLYGLTGYSVIKNTNGTTIVKDPNTSNYIEFRFSIGVT
jgi:hypothetical protein